MVYVFIILYLLVLPVTTIFMLWKIMDSEEEILKILKDKPQKIDTQQIQRQHTNIGQADYDNAFGGRKAYSIYKNTNGLYEPITPSKGIQIKKKEE